MGACFDQCKAFFDQESSFKEQILADANNRGYTPYQEETLDVSAQREGDTKEGLYFGREVARGSREAEIPLHGPNQWPDPEVLPHFRSAIEAYFQACTSAGFTCALLPPAVSFATERIVRISTQDDALHCLNKIMFAIQDLPQMLFGIRQVA